MQQINLHNCLIGRFYFKKTQNGNLIGEFSNNKIDFILTESADIQNGKISTDFIGIYNTTWQQNGQNFFAILIISNKQNTSHKIYEVEWNDTSGKPIFFGQGFIVNDILIGDYRDFKII